MPPNLALSLSWNVTTSLNSDHLPISIDFDNDSPPPRVARSFTNFRRANWDAFKQETEDRFALLPLPSSCSQGEQVWRHAIRKASSHHIPAGYRSDFTPGLDADTIRLVTERDQKRSADPDDPELPDLNRRISVSIADASRKRWLETVSDADRKSNPTRWWNLLKGLSGGRSRQSPNQPINFSGKTFTKKSQIAKEFCKQFANARPYNPNKDSRKIYRDTKVNNPLDRSYTPFSTQNTADAIRRTKNSTAAGPNGITALHLKHIGPRGLAYLTRLFNLSVRDACVPVVWRSANIIPVPKPGKPGDQGLSYRPISLLCPEFKVLERLLLPSLSASLRPNDNQHGFRSERSAVTALIPLVTTVTRGFNQRKPAARTGLLSIDVSKAFDVVRRDRLLAKVERTDLHPNLKRWLAANLVDRRVRVVYQGCTSKWKKSKMGVPQGAVSSPLLWNFFTSDLDSHGYADDFHGFISDPNVEVIEGALGTVAEELADWAAANDMDISAPKSTATLFTPWTRQVNHQLVVKIGDGDVPTVKNPKLLGVQLDPLFTFSVHASTIAKRASSRLNIVRALSDTSFGKDKECLLLTYKSFIRSLFDFAAPVVYPLYSHTSIEKLQKVQNKAFRLATGCHKAASVDHLHAEVEELPVSEHLHLISAQFLASSLQPNHVSRPYTTLDQGPRPLKHTLRSKCINDVEQFLDPNGEIPRGSYEKTKKDLHTKIVSQTIARSGDNRVLGRRPPPINKSESHLPRKIRVTLAQLRSGQCARLKDFQLKIGKSTDDLCPSCSLDSQSVSHLFDCPAKPTTLTVDDLWTYPWGVADHLRTLPSFDDLPPPPQPPQPPPRRRPPQRPPPAPDPPAPPASPVFTPLPFSPPHTPPSPSQSVLSLSLSPTPQTQAPRYARSI